MKRMVVLALAVALTACVDSGGLLVVEHKGADAAECETGGSGGAGGGSGGAGGDCQAGDGGE